MVEVLVYFYEAELRDIQAHKLDASAARIAQADKKGWSKIMKDFDKSIGEMKEAIVGESKAKAAGKRADRSDETLRGFFANAKQFINKATS